MKKTKKILGIIAIAAIIALAFIACDTNAHTHDWDKETGLCSGCSDLYYKIGDTGPGGGKIFFVSKGGFYVTGIGEFEAHYLEAAPVNQGTGLYWTLQSAPFSSINGTETAKGTGKENTKLILTADTNAPAAKACKDYRGPNNKDDWSLPSKDELNEMYKARSKLEISEGIFWSSSENTSQNTWGQNFADGTQVPVTKDLGCYVRAVRAF